MSQEKNLRIIKYLRRAGRIMGLLGILVTMVFTLLACTAISYGPTAWTFILTITSFFLGLIGLALSEFSDMVGGIILLLAASSFFVILYKETEEIEFLIYGIPFLISGALFIIAWRYDRKKIIS